MGGAAKAVTNIVTKTINTVTKTVEAIVHNPVPVIEAAALTVALGPAGAGLSTSIAAPLTSAAVAAANGGNVENIAKAAIAGGIGGVAASEAGAATALSGQSASVVQIASSAVGGSVTGTVAALEAGKPLDQALTAGIQAGATSAAGAGVGQLASAAGEQVQAALPSGTSNVVSQIKEAVQPVTDVVKAAGQAISPTLDVVKQALPSTQPIKQAIQDIVPAKSDLPQLPSSVLKTGQAAGDIVAKDITGAAASGLGAGIGEAIFGQPLAKATPGTPTSGSGTAAPQTSASPGSQALAQALNVGDPLFDKTGGTPKNVWNQASLRVKDETGT